MRHRADAALTLVEQYPFEQMPEDVARLYRLVLALAHASMATEIHGSARAPYAPYPDKLTVTRSRSEEHTSELQSLMRSSYAVFCLTKNTITTRYSMEQPIKTNDNANTKDTD